jgi:hypothetical protein
MSEQTGRHRVVIWLVAFVVIVGGVSWVVTGGIGRHVAPLTHSHPFTLTPGPTPTPLVCSASELALTGVFNQCATVIPDKTSMCSVTGDILDAKLRLTGGNQLFLLYIEVYGVYAGPGRYDLPPWPFGLGTNDVPKVGVSDYWTGALCQSVAGVLTVTGSDGRSGTVSAILQHANGNGVAPGPTLSLNGPWRCR